MARRGRSAKLDSGGEKMMSKIVRVEDGVCWMEFSPPLLQIYLAISIYQVFLDLL